MTWKRWAERLLCVAVGAGLYWLATYDPKDSSLDKNIRRMHGKRFLVVGYDPDSRYPWHSQQGSRGTRGEAAENWIAVTLRTPEEMDRVVQQMSLLPQTRVEPAKK